LVQIAGKGLQLLLLAASPTSLCPWFHRIPKHIACQLTRGPCSGLSCHNHVLRGKFFFSPLFWPGFFTPSYLSPHMSEKSLFWDLGFILVAHSLANIQQQHPT
jgi:hypothetical protein